MYNPPKVTSASGTMSWSSSSSTSQDDSSAAYPELLEDDLNVVDSSKINELFEDDKKRFEEMYEAVNSDEIKHFEAEEETPLVREDEEFCEVSRIGGNVDVSSRRIWNPDRERERVFYPPERQSPILDFLSIMTAFVVAVFAAYFSISN